MESADLPSGSDGIISQHPEFWNEFQSNNTAGSLYSSVRPIPLCPLPSDVLPRRFISFPAAASPCSLSSMSCVSAPVNVPAHLCSCCPSHPGVLMKWQSFVVVAQSMSLSPSYIDMPV